MPIFHLASQKHKKKSGWLLQTAGVAGLATGAEPTQTMVSGSGAPGELQASNVATNPQSFQLPTNLLF
jgi:hypothetical protein